MPDTRRSIRDAGNGRNSTRRQRRVLILRERDGECCYYCGVEMCFAIRSGGLKDHDATIEHVHPLCEGGSDDFDNMCLACNYCNLLVNQITEAVRLNRPQQRIDHLEGLLGARCRLKNNMQAWASGDAICPTNRQSSEVRVLPPAPSSNAPVVQRLGPPTDYRQIGVQIPTGVPSCDRGIAE